MLPYEHGGWGQTDTGGKHGEAATAQSAKRLDGMGDGALQLAVYL
jgi:hypothetical protein